MAKMNLPSLEQVVKHFKKKYGGVTLSADGVGWMIDNNKDDWVQHTYEAPTLPALIRKVAKEENISAP